MPLPFRRQDRIALAALAVIAVLAIFLVVGFVAARHARFASVIEDVDPRFARLVGIEAAAPRLTGALAAQKATLEQFIYPATQDATQSGNDAQQKIRAVFSTAQLAISSSQVLPAKAEGDLDRVPLSVRAEGDLLGLQTALIGLGSQSPAILIDRLNIQGNNETRPGANRVMVQFSFYVLRARS